MRRLTLLILTFTALGVGCGGVAGNGTPRTEQRALPAFSRVEVGGSFKVDIRRGEAQQVELTADENLLPLFEAQVKDDTLTVKPTTQVRPSVGPNLRITLPRPLTALSLSGSAEAQVADLTGARFDLQISGSAEVQLAGATDEARLTVSGSGEIDALGLTARRVAVNISGSGDAQVNATEALDVTVSGSGEIRYRGQPQITRRVTGSGSVEPLAP